VAGRGTVADFPGNFPQAFSRAHLSRERSELLKRVPAVARKLTFADPKSGLDPGKVRAALVDHHLARPAVGCGCSGEEARRGGFAAALG